MSNCRDLAKRIIDYTRTISPDVHMGIREALAYLDMFPEQVPGRTITASEFDEAVESCITEDATVPPHKFAERLGVVCIPDPEPTNLQRLTQAIRDWEQGRGADGILARHLDAIGVRVVTESE